MAVVSEKAETLNETVISRETVTRVESWPKVWAALRLCKVRFQRGFTGEKHLVAGGVRRKATLLYWFILFLPLNSLGRRPKSSLMLWTVGKCFSCGVSGCRLALSFYTPIHQTRCYFRIEALEERVFTLASYDVPPNYMIVPFFYCLNSPHKRACC